MRPAVQKNLNVCEKIQTICNGLSGFASFCTRSLSVQVVETIVRNAYVKKKNHY